MKPYKVRLECSNGNRFETVIDAKCERDARVGAYLKMPKGFTTTTNDPYDVPEIKAYVDGKLSLSND